MINRLISETLPFLSSSLLLKFVCFVCEETYSCTSKFAISEILVTTYAVTKYMKVIIVTILDYDWEVQYLVVILGYIHIPIIYKITSNYQSLLFHMH